MPSGMFLEFPNFQEKNNLERLTEVLETNSWKLSIPFDFEPEFPEIWLSGMHPRSLLVKIFRGQKF